jgi:hypothetical protein
MADSSVPTKAEADKMRAARAAAATEKAETEAYNKSLVYPDTPPSPPPVNKKAKGGSVRGHGCEEKGKTKGRMI